MTRMRRLTAKEVETLLKKYGFELISLDAFKFPTRIPIYKAFQDIKVQCKCV